MKLIIDTNILVSAFVFGGATNIKDAMKNWLYVEEFLRMKRSR